MNNEVTSISTEQANITNTTVKEATTNSQRVPETASVIPRRNPARVRRKPDKLNL